MPCRPKTTRSSISIHSPRMGRDRPSRRKATGWCDFNPLSPHGERHAAAAAATAAKNISIHSPRMGRDDLIRLHTIAINISIHSPRMGRDPLAHRCPQTPAISIHSPRMGRDQPATDTGERQRNFNPLSPHGERPQLTYTALHVAIFQSTLPAWGETSRQTLAES